jgi:WD40 repeat protein
MDVKELDIALSGKVRDTNLINPFPGLRPFGFEESHLFFGREGQSDEILLKLAQNRFAAVIGASGSGKSSLMYCGLIPILYGGFMTDVGSDWVVISSRPGNSPLENLSEAIVKLDASFEHLSEEDKLLETTLTNVILQSSSMGLVDALKPYSLSGTGQTNFLILIDQFEELFRFLKSEDDQETANLSAAFVNLLLKSINQSELPIYIAITMRSDFIGDCSQFPDLTQIINKSHYLIPQMTRDQQRLAIEGPVAVGGGKITKRLSQQLLNDVGNNPDQLPILQHALMRTWDYWIHNREEGESLDLRHYIAIGKLEEALSQHANETFAELDKREREICEVIFKSLTEKGRDNYGIRRAANIKELALIANVTEEEVINIVEKFRRPGRSLLMPPANVPLRSNTIVEISHESLMRIWDRLKNWVDEEFESAQMYRRLSDAAAMYQVGRTGLWRPPDLQLALNWQKKQLPTRAWAQRYNPVFERAMLFLDTSKTAYENEQRSKEQLQKNMLRRARNVAVIFGLLLIISIIFFVFALIQKVEADSKTKEAMQNAMKANRQMEIAEIRLGEAIRQEQKANYSAQIARLRQLEAENARKMAEAQRRFAESESRRAQREQENAIAAAEIAEQERGKAVDAQKRAEMEESNAFRLRMLSIAQGMAVKSLQIQDNQLEGLVAQHAYMFNLRYDGFKHDRYIYNGLYYALKNLQFAEEDTIYSMKYHEGTVRGLTFSSNGENIYSVGTDGKILKWNYSDTKASPEEIWQNDTRNRIIKSTKNGRWLIVGSDLAGVQLFDLQRNKQKPILQKGHLGRVHDIVVANNSKFFISLGDDRTLRLNDFNNSKVLKTFNLEFNKMAMNAKGKVLALSSRSGKVILLNAANVDLSITLISDKSRPVNALAFHPENDILAIGFDDGLISLYDVSKGMNRVRKLTDLSGHSSGISSIRFNEHGNYLATASFDGSIQLWDFNNLNNLPLVLSDHNAQVWNIMFSPDSNYLFAGCENGNIKIWPTKADILSVQICDHINRNMTNSEWERYVASDVKYEETCRPDNLP